MGMMRQYELVERVKSYDPAADEEALNRAYRDSGVALPATAMVSDGLDAAALRRALVIAPPSAHRSAWMKRFRVPQTAFVSGWMAVRGARRRELVPGLGAQFRGREAKPLQQGAATLIGRHIASHDAMQIVLPKQVVNGG